MCTIGEGEISELHVGLKGTMNALFLKDFAEKTRRALEGRVREGKSGVGYASAMTLFARMTRSANRSMAAEARVVRRIFSRFAAGNSPRQIAIDLSGIGCVTVPQDLWDAAKQRQQMVKRDTRPDAREIPFWARQRPRFLVSGLAKCGERGSRDVKIRANLFGCAAARNCGTCGNRLNIRVEMLEKIILDSLRSRLIEPDLFKAFCEEFHREVNRLRNDESRRREAYRAQSRRIPYPPDLAIVVAPAPLIHPNLAEIYRQRVEQLREALYDITRRERPSS